MDDPEQVFGLMAELEQQAAELRECSSNFLDAGLVGHHQNTEAELKSILQTMQTLRLMTGATAQASASDKTETSSWHLKAGGTVPALATNGNDGSSSGRGLDPADGSQALVTPKGSNQQPQKGDLRWTVARKPGHLQLEVEVPRGTRASGVRVEQSDTSVAIQVGDGDEREAVLPPAAGPDSLQVKLSRTEGLLRIQVELQDLPIFGEQMDLWAEAPPSSSGATPSDTLGGRGLAAKLQRDGWAVMDDFMGEPQARALRQQVLLDLYAGRLLQEPPAASNEGSSGVSAEAPGSSGVHMVANAEDQAEAHLTELSRALDKLVASTAPHMSASSSLMREHFRVSAFGDGVQRLAPPEPSKVSTCDSGMPRVLGATLFVAGSSPETGCSDYKLAARFNRLVIFTASSRLAQELCSSPRGQPCIMLTAWYSDSSRLAHCDTVLQEQVQSAWAAVANGSVAVYQEQLERSPADINTRWKVLQMFLDSKQLNEAKATAQVGLHTNPEHPLAWVLAGVVSQHEAAAAGGPASDSGRKFLQKAAGFYRKALSRDEQHPDALRNILVCLEHLVELEELYLLAAKAIRYGAVKYTHPMQRPTIFVPGLRSKPWWDAGRMRFVPRLEAEFPAIREEALALFSTAGPEAQVLGHCDWKRASDPGWRQTEAGEEGWRKVLRKGRWDELVLWGGGERIDENCRLVPRTAKAVENIPEVLELAEAKGGEVLLSVLAPGTHIRAHCGPSNNRLTCHLGLEIPPGLSIRVDGETRGWKEGRCIVFDDSFEHEVWHEGDRRRIVLMFNFWHPDITEAQKTSSIQDYFASAL